MLNEKYKLSAKIEAHKIIIYDTENRELLALKMISLGNYVIRASTGIEITTKTDNAELSLVSKEARVLPIS